MSNSLRKTLEARGLTFSPAQFFLCYGRKVMARSWQHCYTVQNEAEFFWDVTGTKVLMCFPPCYSQSPQLSNFTLDYAQKPQRNCTFMTSASDDLQLGPAVRTGCFFEYTNLYKLRQQYKRVLIQNKDASYTRYEHPALPFPHSIVSFQ